MEILFKAVAKGLLLPPGSLIILLLIGMVLHARRNALGGFFIFLSTLLLFCLSTPFVSYHLAAGVETVVPLDVDDVNEQDHGAIVILGGGRRSNALEYDGEDTVSDGTLVRLRYGAELHRRFGLPVLVTGGTVFSDGASEASLMAAVLKDNYGIVEPWIEDQSADTYQNATLSWAFLEARSIDSVLLVTHASHMPRAMEAFTHAGFKVTPAPMGFTTGRAPTPVPMDFLPNAKAFLASTMSLYELLGRLWYALRHY